MNQPQPIPNVLAVTVQKLSLNRRNSGFRVHAGNPIAKNDGGGQYALAPMHSQQCFGWKKAHLLESNKE